MTAPLTFDYGMRWEVNPPPTGLNLPLYTLTGFPDLAALRLAAPGTPLYPTRWGKSHRAWASRIDSARQDSKSRSRAAHSDSFTILAPARPRPRHGCFRTTDLCGE